MYESLKSLSDAQAGLRKRFQAEGREAVHAACKEFFDKHERAGAIKWEQYAPHFNDGEPCIFSVHYPELAILTDDIIQENAELTEEGEELSDDFWVDEDFYSEYELDSIEGFDNIKEMLKDFEDLAGLIYNNDELMQLVFGDDCAVVITRNSVFVDEDIHHD